MEKRLLGRFCVSFLKLERANKLFENRIKSPTEFRRKNHKPISVGVFPKVSFTRNLFGKVTLRIRAPRFIAVRIENEMPCYARRTVIRHLFSPPLLIFCGTGQMMRLRTNPSICPKKIIEFNFGYRQKAVRFSDSIDFTLH